MIDVSSRNVAVINTSATIVASQIGIRKGPMCCRAIRLVASLVRLKREMAVANEINKPGPNRQKKDHCKRNDDHCRRLYRGETLAGGTKSTWRGFRFAVRRHLKMRRSCAYDPTTIPYARSSGSHRSHMAQHGPLHSAGTRGYTAPNGAVAEWSKAHAWKVCRRETVSRVRIPVAPPASENRDFLRSVASGD